LTDYAAELTVNVGRIEGGTVTNRVPHAATAWLEMRAFDSGIYEQARARILALGGPADGCTVSVTLDDETGPWPRNAATDGLIAVWENAASSLGLRLRAVPRGGLSDGNVLWRDFPTLDGLGPRGENAHCSERSADGTKEQEWVDAASFVPKAVLNALAIQALLRPA
jgi:glutamate carboxypeptidase